jgi:hypothetical protein
MMCPSAGRKGSSASVEGAATYMDDICNQKNRNLSPSLISGKIDAFLVSACAPH